MTNLISKTKRIIHNVYLMNKRFWYFFMECDFRLNIVNPFKKSNKPFRVSARFVKAPSYKFFYLLNIAFFTQSKRLKNSLAKRQESFMNQIPHLVIGHTPVWHTAQKLARRSA